MKHLYLSCALAALSTGFASAAMAKSDDIVVTAPLEGSRIESVQVTDILRRDDIVQNLNGGLGDTLAKQQAQVRPGYPDDFAALIDRELKRMRHAVDAAKIEVQ